MDVARPAFSVLKIQSRTPSVLDAALGKGKQTLS
jgi:hypothetical protein